MITVALDAMGGDFGPCVTVPAAVQALSHYPKLKVILVGDSELITQQLHIIGKDVDDRLSIEHSERCIANNEKPSLALRNSGGTSMRIALDLVASKRADACVSGGNTGALMALSKFRLKLLPGIERPALVSALPCKGGRRTWMLDLGANVSCDADTLAQFAAMGSALAEVHIERSPKVAILNIGEEEIKGNDLVKRCSEILSQTKEINYSGYIEGNQIFSGDADVIVCDGFVGNVCLKTSEGVAHLFINKLQKHCESSKIKSWLAKVLFSSFFKELQVFNPDKNNGASLLGLRGIVIKSHGQAEVSAITNAIGEAVYEVTQQVPSRISDRLEAILLERHY